MNKKYAYKNIIKLYEQANIRRKIKNTKYEKVD